MSGIAPPGSVPNETERDVARDLDRITGPARELEIARALAAARAGHTVEGKRYEVTQHVEMSAAYAGQAIAVDRMRMHLWRAWVGELVERQLRPVGWPTEVRTFWRFAIAAPDHPGLVECSADARWERMRISLSCEAVPT